MCGNDNNGHLDVNGVSKCDCKLDFTNQYGKRRPYWSEMSQEQIKIKSHKEAGSQL